MCLENPLGIIRIVSSIELLHVMKNWFISYCLWLRCDLFSSTRYKVCLLELRGNYILNLSKITDDFHTYFEQVYRQFAILYQKNQFIVNRILMLFLQNVQLRIKLKNLMELSCYDILYTLLFLIIYYGRTIQRFKGFPSSSSRMFCFLSAWNG